MKNIKLVLVLIAFVMFYGCIGSGEHATEKIVKLVTIDDENITIYCYDYSEEKPSYKKEQTKNNGIENTLIEILSRDKYNLKLCRYVVCDENIVDNEINSVFSALIESKFSPDISVIKGNVNDGEKYIETINDLYPIYSYDVTDNKINGVVKDADTGENGIIVDSSLYKILNKEQSFIFDILKGNIKNGIYLFKKDDKNFMAELERISVYNTVVNGVLNVNIFVNVKSYKGMTADVAGKKEFEIYLENSIKENAERIYNDKVIAEEFNLLWYSKIDEFNNIKINVCII